MIQLMIHPTYKFYNTWPGIAQELKIPQLVNEGQGGGSNDENSVKL